MAVVAVEVIATTTKAKAMMATTKEVVAETMTETDAKVATAEMTIPVVVREGVTEEETMKAKVVKKAMANKDVKVVVMTTAMATAQVEVVMASSVVMAATTRGTAVPQGETATGDRQLEAQAEMTTMTKTKQ